MHSPFRPFRLVSLLLALPLAVLGSNDLRAQCTTSWIAGDPLAGVDNMVHCSVLWDPDGSGPQPELLVVGGWFRRIADIEAANIAAYDPTTNTWSAFGTGARETLTYIGNAQVFALNVLPNGDLIVGGDFRNMNGLSAGDVAVYDGTTWSTPNPGGGFLSQVFAVDGLPGGEIVIAGAFGFVGNINVENVALWDNGSWSDMDGGLPFLDQYDLLVQPNGDVVAAGRLGVNRWDGSSWTQIGAASTTFGSLAEVFEFVAMPNGEFLALGSFDLMDQVQVDHVARWDGANWTPYTTPPPGAFELLAGAILPNGNLLVGGQHISSNDNMLLEWDGVTWQVPDPGVRTNSGRVSDLTVMPNGNTVAVGSFRDEQIGAVGLALGTPTGWAALVPGTSLFVTDAAADNAGNLIVGGRFNAIGGIGASGLARFDGTTWTAMPITGGNSPGINQMERLENGDVIAAGQFLNIDGVPAARIARWDGIAWSAMGNGVNDSGVFDIAPLGGGTCAICGEFQVAGSVVANRVALWDGSSWNAMGPNFGFLELVAIAKMPNGEVLAGGDFTVFQGQPAGNLIVWDGLQWSPFGVGANNEIYALEGLSDGRVVAAGEFTSIGGVQAHRVAIWNGAVWSPLGQGVDLRVSDIQELANGDLMFVGRIATSGATGGFPAEGIARWDGTAWSQVDGGLGSDPGVPEALAIWRDELVVAGLFLTAGGLPSTSLARLTSNCPASAVSIGSGCTGPLGTIELVTDELPWVGSAFDAIATGVPGGTLAFVAFSQQPLAIPLAFLLPEGQPGCNLLVAPTITELRITPVGGLPISLDIPASTALVGQMLREQVVPFEFDLSGTLIAVRSSNALELTFGAF